MRVLITGASGFAGRHLARLCAAEGAEAIGLGRGAAGDVEGLAGWIEADLRDERPAARAFNHAGPGQSDEYVVPAFARQIAEAEAEGRQSVELLTGDLRPRRDFTDVRDVVRAYWLLLERAPAGAYNVCSGVATAVADILAGLARHTALTIEQRTDPARLRESEVMEIRGSHDRLTETTGWEPEIPLDRTLADALDSWRARVREGAAR